MITPLYSSSSLRISDTTLLLRLEGSFSSVTLASIRCDTITASVFALIPALNGLKSVSLNVLIVWSVSVLPRCVSPPVCPLPGKCFNVAEICCFCMFFTSVVIILATFFESVPKLRSPISVLFLFVKTSATGARFILNPSSFNSFPCVFPICAIFLLL